jgi:Polyketide cyclase / dehydrase and lipid transport
VLPPADLASHQSRRFQHPDVLGHRRKRQRELRGDFRDPGRPAPEPLEDGATGRVGERSVRGVEAPGILNHLVNYIDARPEREGTLLVMKPQAQRGIDVSVERVIDRPANRVAEFAGDPGNAPKWYANIQSVEWRTPPPLRVGSSLAFVAHFLGRRLSYTYVVRDHVPGERLVMSTEDGPFPMETTYSWRAIGPDRTRMTLRNRGNPRGFSALVRPLMAAAVRRANRKDLENLARLLERPRETGSPAAGPR